MSPVLAALQGRPLPVPPSWIQEQTGLPHELVYLELVSLEARGVASFHPGYYPRDGHIPEAGWFAVEAVGRPE